MILGHLTHKTACWVVGQWQTVTCLRAMHFQMIALFLLQAVVKQLHEECGEKVWWKATVRGKNIVCHNVTLIVLLGIAMRETRELSSTWLLKVPFPQDGFEVKSANYIVYRSFFDMLHVSVYMCVGVHVLACVCFSTCAHVLAWEYPIQLLPIFIAEATHRFYESRRRVFNNSLPWGSSAQQEGS